MSVGTFMDSLERRGVTFDFRDGAVVVAAPAGVLDAEQRAELSRRRAEVDALVRSAYVRWQPETAVPARAPAAQLAFGEEAA